MDPSVIEGIEKDFETAMDDDLNTSMAISNLFALFKHVNALVADRKKAPQDTAATLALIKDRVVRVFSVIGLLQEKPEEFIAVLKNKHLVLLGLSKAAIEDRISQRISAKAAKNYEAADKLRDKLLDQGILLIDSKEGTQWDIKDLYSLPVD